MPKILINEKDFTTPGTPGNYSNYAVLITGFRAKGKTPILTEEAEAFNAQNAEKIAAGEKAPMVPDAIQPDSNGVYEFKSVDDFVATIGKAAPKQSLLPEGAGNKQTYVYHYGNQMAYELLKMGYSIVYKPITALDIVNIDTEETTTIFDNKFWEIFKDKVSYDFRFITHGFLSSTDLSDDAEVNYAYARQPQLEAAVGVIGEIEAEAKKLPYEEGSDEYNKALNDGYLYTLETNENGYNLEGFKAINTETYYKSFLVAKESIEAELTTVLDIITASEKRVVTSTDISNVNCCIANLANYVVNSGEDQFEKYSKDIPGRGDCIALIELDENKYINSDKTKPEIKIINAINELSTAGIDESNGKYCAMTVPSVYYKMDTDAEFDYNVKFPSAFHYLACFLSSLKQGFAEWYAVAGYTRGTSSYMIDHASVKFGEIAINALEPRSWDDPEADYPKFACNVIACFRGSYYLWGNRTAHHLGKKGNLTNGDLVASSFLNIRHLCTTIKKQLYVACRTFTFDPNSDTLWVNFVNLIRPTLEAMKADHGVRDYKIIKVTTDKKAMLKAKIRIIPIEAVEDFDLEISLEDSFGETTAAITE